MLSELQRNRQWPNNSQAETVSLFGLIQALSAIGDINAMKKQLSCLVAILFVLGTTSFYALAKEKNVEESELSGLVMKTLSIYKENGLAGLIALSQDCFRAQESSLSCVQLDIAASQIDFAFAKSIGIHRHPYYEPNAFFQRATPVLVKSGMNMQQANVYLNRTTQEISHLISLQVDASSR